MPPNIEGKKWYVAVNTSLYLEDKKQNIFKDGEEPLLENYNPTIGPRSMMVLLEK